MPANGRRDLIRRLKVNVGVEGDGCTESPLQGCDAVSLYRKLPTFRMKPSPSIFRFLCKFLPDYTVTHPRRPCSSFFIEIIPEPNKIACLINSTYQLFLKHYELHASYIPTPCCYGQSKGCYILLYQQKKPHSINLLLVFVLPSSNVVPYIKFYQICATYCKILGTQ